VSLETTVASLVTAANNLTTVVNGKIGTINSTMATALSQFNEWRNLKDVEGDPAALGTIRRNLLQGFVSGTGGLQGVGGTGAISCRPIWVSVRMSICTSRHP